MYVDVFNIINDIDKNNNMTTNDGETQENVMIFSPGNILLSLITKYWLDN